MKKYLLLIPFVLLFINEGSAQTRFGKGTGEYGEFFASLENMLRNKSPEGQAIQLNGKKYNLLVTWIRDHVHVLKAMKYFMEDTRSGLELFLEQQTPEGLFYDYIYPLDDGVLNRLNFFQRRFTKVFPKDKKQMHRLPVEADVEYLVVEGVYAAWQSTGDTSFLRKWLPALEKAMYYVKSDTIRWSKRYQLAKRGYTIDTWDFQYLPFTRQQYSARFGDASQAIMDIKDTTYMGIMHGDNSGMYAACRQLSRMHAALGHIGMSEVWDREAELYRARANTLLWNGKYYKHYLPDGEKPPYIKFDIENQLSLSNPYDINRGMPDESMSESIIQTYLDLKEKHKSQSFAEWYSLYPSVAPDWSGHEEGTYVNGGILTVTAGELSKAAFQHGYESYGVDILQRLHQLSKKSDNFLYACYKPDGTIDGGLPDNWAQAAVISALVEGLAGVVDRDNGFDRLELSPRWMAAKQDEAEINIAYGASKKRVHYVYRHRADKKTISIQLDGDAAHTLFRVMLPAGITKARARVNGKDKPCTVQKIRDSHYAVLEEMAGSKLDLVVSY